MEWWIWVLIGFALLAVEAATQMIGIGFFGLGAMVVGTLVAFGAGGPLWVQLLLFTVISFAGLLIFRQPIFKRVRGEDRPAEVDTMIGESVTALEEIAARQSGRAELRGTTWTVTNVGDGPISRGQRARVERVEGLTLFIRG